MVATRDGQPVGRICAIVNRVHNDYYKDKTGFFGFFDCIDDQEVATALFRAAEAKLRAEGLTSMRGPYNPTVNDELGLLVEGFDSIPNIMMPYNPPYYEKLIAGAGFSTARTLGAFFIPNVDPSPRVVKIVERVKQRSGLTLRPVNLKKLDSELEIIHGLYNRTLDRNWGFVPITLEDLKFAAGDLKTIADPNLVMIAEKNGQPAGFSMALPNINEILWRIKKSPRWLKPLQFLWHLKMHPPSTARVAVLGVLPEYRGTGIGALFYAESLWYGGKKFRGGELSWIDEDNEEIMSGIKVLGGTREKTYRLYEKAVGANA